MIENPLYERVKDRLAKERSEIKETLLFLDRHSKNPVRMYLMRVVKGGDTCIVSINDGVADVGCPSLGKGALYRSVQLIVFRRNPLSP